MEKERKGIRVLSKKFAKLQTLMNYVNEESLKEAHKKQMKGKAVGVDKVTKEKYEERLEENVKELIERMKKFSYKPQPVRRVYIPKGDGKYRPLGIPAYEDKLVQSCMAYILNEVYEPRFLECSYGFRENQRAHKAIRAINQIIMTKKVNYILDCDIKGYFDNIDQKWLMKFVENDIEDTNFNRYIVRFLKSGIMEDAKVIESDKGTPQGGLISPILANVYLHYVLDLWFEKKIKKELKGEAYLIRYADDFIVMFEYEEEAKQFYETLKERMAKFGLELAEDKTRILPFGRYKGTKETFDFLGFTHYNGTTQTGKYTVGHKISKKKKKQKKKNVKKWLWENQIKGFREIITKLNIKLRGTARYYGISGMFNEVKQLYQIVKEMLYKRLNRLSQRRAFTNERYNIFWDKYIEKPKIYVDIWNWNKT